LRRQQEVEQMVEDYLAVEPERTLHRPMALVLTKSDLLPLGVNPADVASEQFGMTRHALQTHCPLNGQFAVSSLVHQGEKLVPQPAGLAEPLVWLATALQAQDEERLQWLWKQASGQLSMLQRCTACFAARYPDAPATTGHRRRLQERKSQRRRRRGWMAAAAAVCLMVGVWTYDALGHYRASQFEAKHAEQPAAALERWKQHQTWHPMRHWTMTTNASAE
jgi:hypothetical protein